MTDTTFDFSDPMFDEIRALFASRRRRRTAEKTLLALAVGVIAGLGLGMLA